MRSPIEPPVTCNCQRPIGAFFPAFLTMLEQRREAILKEHGESFFPSVEDEKIIMGDVLDALGFHSLCCRTFFMGYCP